MNARIVTVSLGGSRATTVAERRSSGIALLDSALALRPDLVCLPETFATGGSGDNVRPLAERVDGPTVSAVRERALRARSYVICPLFTERDKVVFNSAVLVGRDGEIVGIYDKTHPVTSTADYTEMEGGTMPGPVEPPVFDLDFGRIGMQICFDSGFAESWRRLAELGARLVVWPSAYDGGHLLPAYACLHSYYVVTAVCSERSRIIDPLGGVVTSTDSLMSVASHDLNLDYAICHYDFNYPIPDRIRERYGDRVAIRSDFAMARFMIEPRDPQLTVAGLLAEFGIESCATYFSRHERSYPTLREGDTPSAQHAAHRDRSQYSKAG